MIERCLGKLLNEHNKHVLVKIVIRLKSSQKAVNEQKKSLK